MKQEIYNIQYCKLHVYISVQRSTLFLQPLYPGVPFILLTLYRRLPWDNLVVSTFPSSSHLHHNNFVASVLEQSGSIILYRRHPPPPPPPPPPLFIPKSSRRSLLPSPTSHLPIP